MLTGTKTVQQTKIDVETELVSDIVHKRIGLLGGTFNPPHLGHLIMAEQVCTQLGLDRVDFMPDFIPPHVDEKTAIEAKHRVAMVKLAVEGNPNFGVELAEINRGGKSYSYDTLVALKRAHPENQYYFIIGADMVAYLPKWYRISDLAKLVQFVGVKRPGVKVHSNYPILWVDTPTIDLSSTLIRHKIAKHHSIRYLVPETVCTYIEEHKLYGKK
ncbi:nicotinate-nucleotide adenylyltransferase [Pediococcus ethanolidurans]|uniref:nicotinate-nucleotide adenylyltransferase n=1 Tax=Pediococcus ethanolidurans TaxID=319653 RepID=UPI001C1ED6B4|nr:nicotinate-nucleotide adenylyltransferase [Pediococcus ethanolidurans]MBU7554745.1 nicotinate-nucleotide adenylyltransferase [Pediococcus ethanolidurans]MBU7562737.1 nicotinate-nucleotide adenylyltransferase [Pediococcus ethanolidurans]MCT4397501.1 nicotinate-nucleotide adenylyltransferase [Pediococcus ethanolidurans]MCV3314379.1 nicotinate-nucleotide adenylyltransferase [Pediococcus ethanolidurans]MCV3320656.1 nicotinate-nucleotide adenylyltransferase [Pediococcus ethanolidurans]